MADSVVVTLDGRVHDAGQPLLFADDLAAVRGDGVFETLLVRGGAACAVELHLARLAASATALELPAPDLDEWRTVIDKSVGLWTEGSVDEAVLRLVLSRGRESGGEPTAFVTVGPLPERVRTARANGVSVITLDRGYSVEFSATAPWQLAGAKTLSYATNMAALRHASAQGVDDVIYLSSEGRVLEGPRSTVVLARGKTLVTPSVEQGILAGTTVAGLFQVAEAAGWTCEHGHLYPADLIAADSVWLVSSVTLAARVMAMNGVVLGRSGSGEEVAEMVDRAVEVAATR
ncbi:4-amino-4-deoxychorismate lyase [Rhodococcus sp. 14-2483-1-1]|uniref:aminodeoxychorismate lyase n=1 Tax=Rhodococcus sp. 14-2483-1-1 TaxID=2023148 RepID=UPI000B9C077E|nr:aminodeoxychorismate lyase [Rhodococcus sp. 14-2483-1-1]OZF40430.1 4-amino-4-deoxychorismate lyase [Rhodococcus sp. 14-2483-1-1]